MAASTGGISELGPDNLGELFSKLYPVRAKWYNLGLGLGISCNDLDAIKKDCKEDASECLKEVLKLWLRSQHPGIADLIKSLNEPIVGEGQLAKELLTWSTSSPSIDTIPSPPNCSSIQSEEPKDLRPKSSPLLSDSMTQTDVVSTLSPGARPYARNVKVEDFKFLIRQDLKKLKEEFITLQFNIRESLTVKVSPEKITAHVLADYANVHESSERAVSLFNDRDKERLHSPTSVNEIFEVLQKYWSFVKCEMLFSIAKHCGDESDHVKVREYQDHLKTFFENRKLSEIPEELLSSNSVDELHEKLLIKLDRDDPCWKDIEELEFKICEILEIMPSALVIVGFRQGCVELRFNIPRHIAQIIFHKDLSSAQQEKLKALFVLTLSCGGFHATIAEEKHMEDIHKDISCPPDHHNTGGQIEAVLIERFLPQLKNVKMEGEVINSFLPDLVTAVSDSVLSVSDQCLAKGLINETAYKRVLESGGTSEDKARTLILAVKKSTETDSRCFELFLSSLKETLPYSSKGSLLSAMKNKLVKKSEDKSLVSTAGHGSLQVASIDAREIIKQQTTFLGKLEDAIRQHEHAIAEKILLEDRVKSKENENLQLKSELNSLSSHVLDSAVIGTKIEDTESRISACEAEMSALKGRIEELESIIEEQGMQVKRGKNALSLGMMNMTGQLFFLAQKEINEVKQLGVKKEAEYKVTLEGKEQELLKAKSEGEEKQRQNFEALKEKDAQLMLAQREKQKVEEEIKVKSLQHEVALKDVDYKLKIKELEQKEIDEVKQLSVKKEEEYLSTLQKKETQHKMLIDKKEEELMAAKTEAAQKDEQSKKLIDGKDWELMAAKAEAAQKAEQLLAIQKERQKLEHELALKDKDLKIKELELEMATKPPIGASSGSKKSTSGRLSWFKSKPKHDEEDDDIEKDGPIASSRVFSDY